MENPGEAVLTSGLTVSDYIAGVQLNREQIRARNKETLNSIINSTNIDEAAKQEAIQNKMCIRDSGSVEWMPGTTVYLREWSADDEEMSFTALSSFSIS